MAAVPGQLPLIDAVKRGDAGAVAALLGNAQHDGNAKHRRGPRRELLSERLPRTENTAMHIAAAEGRVPVLRALLDGCSQASRRGVLDAVNANRDTPLMFASARGHAGAAAMLLKV